MFLNTFFLGILDYKTATIIIPMVQVRAGAGPEGAGLGAAAELRWDWRCDLRPSLGLSL